MTSTPRRTYNEGATMLTLSSLSLLVGCAPQSQESADLAQAGPRVEGDLGQTYTLDGGDSTGTRWSWQMIEQPAASQLLPRDLHDADTPWPWFVADAEGVYTLELRACDAEGRCATDRTQALVGPHARPTLHGIDGAPNLPALRSPPGNGAPQAQASARRVLGLSGAVLLDGSGTVDPDGDDLRWRWSFASLPASSQLSSVDIEDRSSAIARFTPDAAGLYRLRLRVSDGGATDSVTLSVDVPVDRSLDDEPIED